MIKQRWTKRPPAALKADRVLLYRTGTRLPEWWEHGFQYLDKFDVVLVREGRHEDEAVGHWHSWGLETTMRVPVWRFDIVWMRRNSTTRAILSYWREYSPGPIVDIGFMYWL